MIMFMGDNYMEKCVLLFSGGVDSFIAYHVLKAEHQEIIPLYVNYNGRYTDKELSVVQKLIPSCQINWRTFNFSSFEYGKKAFIKNRNVYLALVASNYSNNIAMAGLKDDNVGDKCPKAFEAMSMLLNTVNDDDVYTVFSPFFFKEKIDIIEWYINNVGDIGLLTKTVSCYDEKYSYCGHCPACFRKFCAFNYCDVPVPMFRNQEMAKEYLEAVDRGEYTCRRAESIKLACKRIGL